MSLLLFLVGAAVALKFSLLFGLIIIIISLIVGIVKARDNGRVVNYITIALCLITMGYFGYIFFFEVKNTNEFTNKLRDKIAINDAEYIIEEVKLYYDTKENNHDLLKQYVVSFDKNGNSKKIPLKTTGKVVSGKVTLEKELNGVVVATAKDLVIEEKNDTYICNTKDNKKVECKKK